MSVPNHFGAAMNKDLEENRGVSTSLFNDSDGDVTLRTSTGKGFQVSKAILKFASPVFKTMFSLPQPKPSSESSLALPIIPISESSTTVDLLLRFFYPVENPDLASKDVAIILEVLLAIQKYEIDFVASPVREAFKKRVETSSEQALSGSLLAFRRKLDVQARLAAKACLKWPLRDLINIVPELELVSGMDYANLLKYHQRAGQAVADLFTSHGFLTGPCSMGEATSCCGKTSRTQSSVFGGPILMRSWWEHWSNPLIAALREAPLGIEVISLSTLSPHLTTKHSCDTCRKDALDKWETGKDAIIDAINEKVDEVELRLGWM